MPASLLCKTLILQLISREYARFKSNLSALLEPGQSSAGLSPHWPKLWRWSHPISQIEIHVSGRTSHRKFIPHLEPPPFWKIPCRNECLPCYFLLHECQFPQQRCFLVACLHLPQLTIAALSMFFHSRNSMWCDLTPDCKEIIFLAILVGCWLKR